MNSFTALRRPSPWPMVKTPRAQLLAMLDRICEIEALLGAHERAECEMSEEQQSALRFELLDIETRPLTLEQTTVIRDVARMHLEVRAYLSQTPCETAH